MHENWLVVKEDIFNIAEQSILIISYDTQWGPGVLAIVEVEGAGSFINGNVDRNFRMEETQNGADSPQECASSAGA